MTNTRKELDQAILDFCDGQDDVGDDAIRLHAMHAGLVEARRKAFRDGVLACVRFLSKLTRELDRSDRHALVTAIDAIGQEGLAENWQGL
ncbi:hypothetical protein LCGC14_2278700 [marine sediment metagenome]|uniref:Uncharacterized protein n=1 Tax=marine sediment metagenome TaxID=412755 RepID=A0A0F9CV20_9ZZZZ